MRILKKVREKWWAVFAIGLVAGAAVILGIRYFTYSPENVHYHANMAVYIDGERFEFKGAQYYREVATCSSTSDLRLPQQRAHLHDNVNSVVHVHDHMVTWGQFFENLGWYVGSDFIETDDGTRYLADDNNKINVIINGQDYTGLTPVGNMVIKDRDRLLVSYGPSDQSTLQQQYKTVPSSAGHYDQAQDPASCAGNEKLTPKTRLHHLF